MDLRFYHLYKDAGGAALLPCTLYCPKSCKYIILCNLHKIYHKLSVIMSFPGGASSKESTCQCRRCKRLEFDPWVGKIPWRRKWHPTPVFLHGKSPEQRRLAGYGPWGCKGTRVSIWLLFAFLELALIAAAPPFHRAFPQEILQNPQRLPLSPPVSLPAGHPLTPKPKRPFLVQTKS